MSVTAVTRYTQNKINQNLNDFRIRQHAVLIFGLRFRLHFYRRKGDRSYDELRTLTTTVTHLFTLRIQKCFRMRRHCVVRAQPLIFERRSGAHLWCVAWKTFSIFHETSRNIDRESRLGFAVWKVGIRQLDWVRNVLGSEWVMDTPRMQAVRNKLNEIFLLCVGCSIWRRHWQFSHLPNVFSSVSFANHAVDSDMCAWLTCGLVYLWAGRLDAFKSQRKWENRYQKGGYYARFVTWCRIHGVVSITMK